MTIINKVSAKSVMPGVTAIPDVVDAPTIGSATAGIESATVTYTAAATGGTATSFTAISTPGSITGSSATSPITVSGLTGGTAYTFKVYGTNASGVWSAVQSSASNSVTPTTTAFESIASATGTGSSATITFSSIPSTYQHLQIRFIAKTTSTAGSDFPLDMRFNSDTASNYPHHDLWGDGTTAQANGAAATTRIVLSSRIPDSYSSWSNMFEVGVIDIHDYASTSKYKTARAILGKNINTASAADQEIKLKSGLWMSTSAINSISFITSGSNWTTTTQFALYGIKGA